MHEAEAEAFDVGRKDDDRCLPNQLIHPRGLDRAGFEHREIRVAVRLAGDDDEFNSRKSLRQLLPCSIGTFMREMIAEY